MANNEHSIYYFIWIFGLTFLAGAINILSVLLLGSTISHYTGNISNAAIALANGNYHICISLFIFIGLFFLGSTVSGYIFHHTNVHYKKYYAVLPLIFGLVILIVDGLTQNLNILVHIFAFGMGIQNGTYIKYRGLKIRTTHITGYLTDAAFYLGKVFRGETHCIKVVAFYLFSILLFFLGGVVATYLLMELGHQSVTLLASIYVIFGLIVGYGVYYENYRMVDII